LARHALTSANPVKRGTSRPVPRGVPCRIGLLTCGAAPGARRLTTTKDA
jgi:hypothetical protein